MCTSLLLLLLLLLCCVAVHACHDHTTNDACSTDPVCVWCVVQARCEELPGTACTSGSSEPVSWKDLTIFVLFIVLAIMCFALCMCYHEQRCHSNWKPLLDAVAERRWPWRSAETRQQLV